jgi:aarF domain-containing kinase
MTLLRALYLASLFSPLLVTLPIAFFGSRDALCDYERSGRLWWYNLLVKQMERAGPTFIKACMHSCG